MFDNFGVPSEVAEITRILRGRSARTYVGVTAFVLLCLLAVGVIDKWPKDGDYQLWKALWAVVRASYTNFFSSVFGIFVSIFLARFLFGDNPSENSAIDAGIRRVTQSNNPLNLVKEITRKLSRVSSEVTISDNWLCKLHEEMYPALKLAIIAAVERGAKVNIVIMHPNSPLGHRRELVVAKVRHNVLKDIQDSLEMLRHIFLECVSRNSFDKNGGMLSVFCADSYLSMSAYVLPQLAYFGFYGSKDTSILGPQMLIEVDNMVGRMVDEYAKEAVKIGLVKQKVESYKGKPMRYGCRVNLATLSDSAEGDDIVLKAEDKARLVKLNEELASAGAVTIESVCEQVLDSQAIDFFHVLSRKDAVLKLANFLELFPEGHERRKSKGELIAAINELLTVLRANDT